MILFFQNGEVKNNFIIDLLKQKNWNKMHEIFFSLRFLRLKLNLIVL